jgi:hypothetical protein
MLGNTHRLIDYDGDYMKKLFILLLLTGLLAACGETETKTPTTPTTPNPTDPNPTDPNPTDPNPDASVVILTFSASNSLDYTLENVEGPTGVATPGTDPELTLTVGKRYQIVNKALGVHPFALSSSPTHSVSDLLLHEDGSGSFATDAAVNYVKNSDGFSFTLTQALADQLKSYLCTFHPEMFGTVKVTAQ